MSLEEVKMALSRNLNDEGEYWFDKEDFLDSFDLISELLNCGYIVSSMYIDGIQHYFVSKD